jgi:hypothetical protein
MMPATVATRQGFFYKLPVGYRAGHERLDATAWRKMFWPYGEMEEITSLRQSSSTRCTSDGRTMGTPMKSFRSKVRFADVAMDSAFRQCADTALRMMDIDLMYLP